MMRISGVLFTVLTGVLSVGSASANDASKGIPDPPMPPSVPDVEICSVFATEYRGFVDQIVELLSGCSADTDAPSGLGQCQSLEERVDFEINKYGIQVNSCFTDAMYYQPLEDELAPRELEALKSSTTETIAGLYKTRDALFSDALKLNAPPIIPSKVSIVMRAGQLWHMTELHGSDEFMIDKVASMALALNAFNPDGLSDLSAGSAILSLNQLTAEVRQGLDVALAELENGTTVEAQQLPDEDRQQARALFSQGYDFMQKENYREALVSYRRGLELDPQESSAWFYMGEALRSQLLHDEAYDAFKKSLELNPDNPTAPLAEDRVSDRFRLFCNLVHPESGNKIEPSEITVHLDERLWYTEKNSGYINRYSDSQIGLDMFFESQNWIPLDLEINRYSGQSDYASCQGIDYVAPRRKAPAAAAAAEAASQHENSDELAPEIAADVLSQCALRNNIECLIQLLSEGLDPNVINTVGSTALLLAVEAGQVESAKHLVEAGADPLKPTRNGSAEDAALAGGSSEMIVAVVGASERGAQALLEVALREGDGALAQQAIDLGANIDAANEDGLTPVAQAVVTGNQEALELLLQTGATTEPAANPDFRPLVIAILSGNARAVEALLASDARIDFHVRGLSALSFAVLRGDPAMVDILLKAGADPGLVDESGSLPAEVAVAVGNRELAERLGAESAPVDLMAALSASTSGSDIPALLELGADPNQKDEQGFSVLHHVALRGDTASTIALIDSGADVLAAGPDGRTVLHLALALEDPHTRWEITDSVLSRAKIQGKASSLARLADASGRSSGVLVGQRLVPIGGHEGGNPFERLTWLDESFASEVASAADSDGVSLLSAATLSDNGMLVGRLIALGVSPELTVNGATLQDVARARSAWSALAALPSDRDPPKGFWKDASQEVFREMQSRLQDWGYYTGTTDGEFGPGSEAALASMLKDRKSEIVEMARALGTPGSYEETENEERPGIETLRASIGGESCTWHVRHWNPGGSDVSYIGCMHGTDWTSQGVALFISESGAEEMVLTGPSGLRDIQKISEDSGMSPAHLPPAESMLSCFDLWHERNSIFHRNGNCFRTAKAKQYFDNSGCWTTSPQLSQAEMQRVSQIQALERQNGC